MNPKTPWMAAAALVAAMVVCHAPAQGADPEGARESTAGAGAPGAQVRAPGSVAPGLPFASGENPLPAFDFDRSALDAMTTGKGFHGVLFPGHLPFAFQFGGDDDPEGVVIVFGRLVPAGDGTPVPWPQVNTPGGGTITLDNGDGALSFYDAQGKSAHAGEKSVTEPMGVAPIYLKSAKGPTLIRERLLAARIENQRAIEIVPRDFATPVDAPGACLEVELRNRLNAPVAGTFALAEPEGIVLKATVARVELAPGESRVFEFPVASATPAPANSYLLRCSYRDDATGATAALSAKLSAAH